MLERMITQRLLEALRLFPVIAVTGARQVGKTTLVKGGSVAAGRRYFNLDDFSILGTAKNEPAALFATGESFTFDEVQRAPELLLAIKQAVDSDRTPGRFLLTGSADLSLVANLAEVLAGRCVLLPLRPFAWREIKKVRGNPWLCRCFETASVGELVPELEEKISRSRFDLFALLKKGGYPPAALAGDDKFLHTWFQGYRQTYLERDVRSVQNIANLLEFSKLLIMISARSGGILSKAGLGRDAAIPASTLDRYLNLLEVTFQVTRIPAYHTNIAKRQTKSPKIFWSDTGMALYLMDIQSGEALRHFGKLGSIVETFVVSELQKLTEAFLPEARLFYWRTHTGLEVDAVIVKGLRILPVEVKASQSISREDLKSLKEFLSAQKAAHCPLGLIFYLGNEIISVASNILACPIQVLLA